MDLVSIALAVKKALETLFDSGQVGRREKPVLTFNGDTTGKTVIEVNGTPLAKITDTAHELSKVTKLTVLFVGQGEMVITPETDGYTVGVVNGVPAITIGEEIFALSIPGNAEGGGEGVYVVATADAYISRIEFAETIHPIDPKYLPGVCLPVVELSTAATAEGATLTAEESARMDEVAAMGVPIVLKCKADMGGTTMNLFTTACVMKMGGQNAITALFNGGAINIVNGTMTVTLG